MMNKEYQALSGAEHPITPPPELVQQWLGAHFGTTVTGEVSDVELALATQAARWGANQELEACCAWMDNHLFSSPSTPLRAARRPKPPTLKEQALELVRRIEGAGSSWALSELSVVRRALEQLDD